MCKNKGSLASVDMSGEAASHHAAKTKEFFLSIVNGTCRECTVDLLNITSIDLPFLQLIISFCKTMDFQNKKITFNALPSNHVVLNYMTSVGISLDMLQGARR